MSPKQRATLAALDGRCLISWDVGLELGISTGAASARLRGLKRLGLVDSFVPDPAHEDRSLYWELTEEGRAALKSFARQPQEGR